MEFDAGAGCVLSWCLMAVVGGASLLAAWRLGLMKRYRVETSSPRHGGERVAEVLKAHGVKYLFTLVGGHISPILVACEKIGIRVVDTRHEATAVFAADSVARLSGSIGVAAVTAGPGLTNTVTAIKNAQVAETPVLLIGGAAATLLQGRGALQDIDQLSLFKTLCKFCSTVRTVRDIVPVLRKAIAIAQSGTPGPVFVEFPLDVLYPYYLVQREVIPKNAPKGLVGKAINWYLQNHLNNLFSGAWDTRDVSPLSVDFPMATDAEVQSCMEMVSRSKRPIILVGSQATLPPTPVNKLRSALESLAIPCFLGGMARGMLGRDSPIHIRQNRKDALKKADLVILADPQSYSTDEYIIISTMEPYWRLRVLESKQVLEELSRSNRINGRKINGTVCDFRMSYGRVLTKHSKIIAVNRDKSQLLKNSDIFWKPTLAVKGDAGSFLIQLAEGLKGYQAPSDWTQSLKEEDVKKEKANSEKSEEKLEKNLNPLKVLHHVEHLLEEDSIIVTDGGDFVSTAAYILRPRGPLQWLDPGAFGTLGVGGGFALGAKLCRPESQVWIIYGDGSLGYSIAEFDTFKRHKVPVIALVGNDAGWSQISREQVPLLGSNVACDLAYTDYHTVAEGYGGKGFLLTTENEEKMDDIIRSAQEECRNGTPTLLNILIGKSNFREGSISV